MVQMMVRFEADFRSSILVHTLRCVYPEQVMTDMPLRSTPLPTISHRRRDVAAKKDETNGQTGYRGAPQRRSCMYLTLSIAE